MGFCENFPTGNEFYARMAMETRKQAIPLSGTFELTPRCNFHCAMCYVHLEEERIARFGTELTAEEWIRMGEEAREAGMLQLCITGGEPLLHPEFEKIYTALSRMGFFITLQTNASCITRKTEELLEEYPPALAKISLYGSNDRIYEKVCGIPHGFTAADRGIRILQKLQIPVLLVTTVIKQNRQDLPKIARYCRERKIPWIYSTTAYPSLRGADTHAEEVAIDEETATDYREDVRRMIREPVMQDGKKPCEYCKGYRNSFWITWNGNMQFCSFMKEPDLSIRQRPFAEAWKQLVEYEEALQWPEECKICSIRHICRRCAGMLAVKSGHTGKTDPKFCEKMRRYVREEQNKGHEI